MLCPQATAAVDRRIDLNAYLGEEVEKRIAIIQARMCSSRLPGKVMADLGGRPIIAWSVAAAQRVCGIDGTIVATSSSNADDLVAEWCERNGVPYHRGPLDDVLERFRQVAEAAAAHVIMRLTADCPFLDPQVCGQVLRLFQETGVDYASNVDPPTWPDGLDCEVFTATALKEAAENAMSAGDREHVTPYIRNNRGRFKVSNLTCPIPDLHRLRWTVDESADLELARAVALRLRSTEPPSFLDILEVIRREPHLTELNSGMSRGVGFVKHGRTLQRQHGGYVESNAMLKRAESVIPGGTQTFSKSRTQYPTPAAPLYVTHGRGSRVWDVDGNEYVDLVCGLLPVVLGYCDSDVDRAVRDQLCAGITFSLAHELEIEVAERLVELIPCAEAARFGKNGSDATAAAIRLARAFTGRDRVAVCGYHGWQDWYIGATTRNKGVPRCVGELTSVVPYNDIRALYSLLMRYPGEFAAVILEPVGVQEPQVGYLGELRELVHGHGTLLIFDEVITGFRISLGGAQRYYGVTPDLSAFGKGMGNGMPISAITGRGAVMKEMEEIFFSGTFGGETLSLAAAVAVMDKMRREPVIETLWRQGKKLATGAREAIEKAGLDDVMSVKGLPPWTVVCFKDHPEARRDAIKTVFVREMLKRGVLISGSHNISYSLTDDDVSTVLLAYDGALSILSNEMRTGDLENRLGLSVVRPVFSVR